MSHIDFDDDIPVLPLVRKVAVVSGGWSHEAHYNASSSVVAAIGRLGLEAVHLDYRDPAFVAKMSEVSINLVFPQTLGAYGEDGTLQGLLDYLGKRYVGSGPLASSICANKLACSNFVRGLECGDMLQALPGLLVSRQKCLSHAYIVEHLGSPFIFKPLSTGASFGLKLIANAAEYEACLDASLVEFDYMLAESFCRGHEYSVGMIQIGENMLVLPPAFVRSNLDGSVYGPDAKAQASHGSIAVDPETSLRLRQAAERVADRLGLCGMARMDVIVNAEGVVHLIEVNTLPGLLPGLCLFPKMCAAAGIGYDRMIRMMIDSALQEKPMQMRKLANPPARPAVLDRYHAVQSTGTKNVLA